MSLSGADANGMLTVSAIQLRSALRRHAAGIVVITWLGPAGPVGFTATSFTAASLEPTLVSFYLGVNSSSWDSLREVEHFAVNIMSAGQQLLADRFARKGVDRFAGVAWESGPLCVPLINGVQANLACTRTAVLSVGDHVLVVGAVRHVRVANTCPLVYHDGQYGSFTAY